MAGGPVPLTTAPAVPSEARAVAGTRTDRLAVAVVIVPTAVLSVVAGLTRVGPWGDQAGIELATERAARFTELLGPYSRFGWSHPGPLWFYLLAAPFRLFGGTGRALAAATVVVTGVAALAVVVATGRLAGVAAGRWAAAVVVLELAALGPRTVAEVWNPVAIIVPATLFLVCCAGLATGRWWMLVGAVATGSFLVQTDVSTGLVVAVVGLAAVLSAAVATRAAPARPVAAAVGLGVVLWLAPIVQQVAGSPGNLGRVVRFFFSGGSKAQAPGVATHHPLGAAARAVAAALWPPLHGRLGGGLPGPGGAALILLGMVGFAVVAAVAGVRTGRPLATALGVGALLAVVVGVVSATRVTGPLYPYLTEWLSGADAVVLLGLLLAFTRTPPGGRARSREWAGTAPSAVAAPSAVEAPASVPAGPATLVAVLAALVLIGLAGAQRPAAPPGGSEVDALWARVRTSLPAPGQDRPAVEVKVATADRWPWAGGLLVDLEHSGYRPVAEPGWLFLFGTQLAYAGRPAAVVSVWRPGAGPAPPGREVAVAGSTAAFVSPP